MSSRPRSRSSRSISSAKSGLPLEWSATRVVSAAGTSAGRTSRVAASSDVRPASESPPSLSTRPVRTVRRQICSKSRDAVSREN
eukprot:6168450-Prymnesium_polylepis.2